MGANLGPLVLLHGYPLDHTMWYGVIAALGSGIRTISPDLRGFGKAGPPRGEPRIEAMAKDVLAQLKQDNIDRAVFAGMSMGGYVALAIAELEPERVAGLAIINSQPFADTDEARASRREMIKKVRAEGSAVAARALIPKMFHGARAENPDFQKFLLDGADAAGVEGITWALEAMAQRPDRSKIIAEAKFPVLIVHSPHDNIIPIDKARQMGALNRNANFVTVKNGGHGAALETPDEVATALRKFLKICAGSAEHAAPAPG